MKKLLLLLLCVPLMFSCGEENEEKDNTENTEKNVHIPDSNFKAYLVGNKYINYNGDTEIQVFEAVLFSGTISCENLNIYDLTGIEEFTALTDLQCSNNQLTSLDVSQNTALTWLWCQDNQLTSLDVSNNIDLTFLICKRNQLTSLDVSNNMFLTNLSCGGNQLTSLDVSNNMFLTNLSCGGNQLTSLDVSNNTDLYFLSCEANNFNGRNLMYKINSKCWDEEGNEIDCE